ncbi:DUF2000 domain-containing protein [Tetragenococcus halophilus]|uniref:DUF2000 domain-containing protein n=2 Tax=Tetragenococcus halophilus TaxID=51669 RepID=A0A2H6CVA7_TETHA|nr:DUF2000 domain-containing protein [Tetragenococcus halophilus]MDN5811395.1 DUF2000 domain-containing protein [Tetragenococcus koreensis]MDN6278360.1 DUF2000 domain-containing protein [Lactococcus lactis]MDN6640494.1 DUF2000 domain-containing protein [Tetragenococcus sp.]AOF48447.1 hypothetical protein AC806_03005 [Tetragenococcus halophilus]AYW49906.1 DUF2000 domain-containing protein [Tetragenococcus halophilus]
MSTENKCVILIDDALSLGLVANTAAILGMSLGKKHPELIGPDTLDGDQFLHSGIIYIPVPILKSNRKNLFDLRNRLYQKDYQNIETVDFTNLAQSCKTYEEYMDRFQQMKATDLQYMGIGLYGPKKIINKLTGNLSLLK